MLLAIINVISYYVRRDKPVAVMEKYRIGFRNRLTVPNKRFIWIKEILRII